MSFRYSVTIRPGATAVFELKGRELEIDVVGTAKTTNDYAHAFQLGQKIIRYGKRIREAIQPLLSANAPLL